MNLFYFFINTNIYISLAAVFLTIETQIQLGMKPQFHPYLFIVFFATILEYNLHRLITILTNPLALEGDKHRWVKNHKTAFYFLVLVSMIGFICAALLAKKTVLLFLAPIGLITLLYSLPLFKSRGNYLRLREIPFLKIFLIAFVWSTTTILLPLIESGNPYNKAHILFMLIERFLFIFAITVPFDIRDIIHDKQVGLKTFPVIIGEKRSILFANIALFLFSLLCIFHYQNITFPFLTTAFLLSAIVAIFFLNSKKVQKLPYYHYGILDGTMLLQGLLVLTFRYIFPFT